ncbi:hypothetical protein G6F41_013576 [Rhizopus arrhizus]|nr:hypothetical protein G6F41_013576 [Rhizopus arrhizus]
MQINNYLQVLVKDLKELYYGDFFTCTAESPNAPVQVRAALFLIACDIPASRKVSGFTSFNATVPCNKCSTAFPARHNTNLQRDFSFGLEDLDGWSLRTNIENRRHARNWKEASTKKQRTDLEQKFGTRFSALHDLEYLDLVRCTAIDPMHGLFLGTAKKMIKIWRTTTVRDKISPFFGFFAMPRRELNLKLRFADETFARKLDKIIGVT